MAGSSIGGLPRAGKQAGPASPILSCSLLDLEHEVKLKALKSKSPELSVD